MDLKPLANRVIVKPEDKAEISQGGIILPYIVDKGDPCFGTVVAVGCGLPDNPTVLKVGDRVLYLDLIVKGITDKEGEKFHMLREHDILAKIED